MAAMHGCRYYLVITTQREFVLQLALKDLQKVPAGCGSGQANELVRGAPQNLR